MFNDNLKKFKFELWIAYKTNGRAVKKCNGESLANLSRAYLKNPNE